MTTVPEISVEELKTLRDKGSDFCLLDVREPEEYAKANLGGVLIPLRELPHRLNELNRNQHIVIHCRSGSRSRQATELLLHEGFTSVVNLSGGITAWANQIDPSLTVQ